MVIESLPKASLHSPPGVENPTWGQVTAEVGRDTNPETQRELKSTTSSEESPQR